MGDAPFLIGLVGPREVRDPAALRAAARPHLTRWRAAQPTAIAVAELASGVDTILLAVAAECGLALGIIEPYPGYVDAATPDEAALQMALWASATFVQRFDPPLPPAAAFARAGSWLVERAAVLLVAWDGVDSGVAGGTADVIRQARQAGRLVTELTIQR